MDVNAVGLGLLGDTNGLLVVCDLLFTDLGEGVQDRVDLLDVERKAIVRVL